MKFFKYLLFLLLIGFIGLSIYIAVQPNSFSFKRSQLINAPVTLVYNTVANYKSWPKFSPWLELDPKAKLSYNKISYGKNASYSWKSGVIGEGTMKTIDAKLNTYLKQNIQFRAPISSSANINWYFEPKNNTTKVTWEMLGKKDFFTKIVTTFNGSIERNTAPDFERGLFKLDSITSSAIKTYFITINGITKYGGGFFLYKTSTCKITDFKTVMAENFSKLKTFAYNNNIIEKGNPFINYHKWDRKNNTVIFSSCLPTVGKVLTSETEILTGQIKPFRAVKTTLKGDYKNLKEAWGKTMNYISLNNLKQPENETMLEIYLTDPNIEVNPANWVTEIFVEIKQ